MSPFDDEAPEPDDLGAAARRGDAPWEEELLDPFLLELAPRDIALLARLGLTPRPEPALALNREALLEEAHVEGRFARFAPTVARLMDTALPKAHGLLDGIHRPESWHGSPLPGVALYDIDGGPGVRAAITGFVRMPAGAHFPHHTHIGTEHVFVLQGTLLDEPSGAVVRPGEIATHQEGTAHSFVVRPGPDLLYMFVGQAGVEIGGEVFGPGDVRL